MPAIHTERIIPAPPEAVWAVLEDLPSWPRWNPVVGGLSGRLALGETLALTLRLGARRVTLRVEVVTLDPGRRLAWRGGVSGVSWAVHGFEVAPHAQGTRFLHDERFGGLLPTLAWPVLRSRLTPRYEATNAGLAAEVASRGDGR